MIITKVAQFVLLECNLNKIAAYLLANSNEYIYIYMCYFVYICNNVWYNHFVYDREAKLLKQLNKNNIMITKLVLIL